MIELAGVMGVENQVVTHTCTHYLEVLRQSSFFLRKCWSLPAIMQIVEANISYRNIYLFIPNFLLIILEIMKLML